MVVNFRWETVCWNATKPWLTRRWWGLDLRYPRQATGPSPRKIHIQKCTVSDLVFVVGLRTKTRTSGDLGSLCPIMIIALPCLNFASRVSCVSCSQLHSHLSSDPEWLLWYLGECALAMILKLQLRVTVVILWHWAEWQLKMWTIGVSNCVW